MKRILLLLVAVFSVNLMTAQIQKAPLVNYKMETKSSSSSLVQNQSSSLIQPAPLWSDDCLSLIHI